MLSTFILRVLDRNFCLDTGYPEFVHAFPQSLQESVGIRAFLRFDHC
jgi:hypothetical protein